MPDNKMLEWDALGEHYYETGVDRGVLFVYDETGKNYKNGVAWNGLTSAAVTPEGGDFNAMYADNITYLNIRSAEKVNATIECYQTPPEFADVDGSKQIGKGVYAGTQKRSSCAVSWRSRIGNDLTDEAGYKLHLLYGCQATPSEKTYETVNESPNAATMSYELTTTPVKIPLEGFRPTSYFCIDSRETDPSKLAEFEKKLYGSEEAASTLPTVEELISIFSED